MQKEKIFSILLLAAFIVSTIAIAPIQPATAQTTPTMKTYPIVDAIPNPVGVGQETLIKMGISEAAPSASYGWSGITITVEKPDGTTETLGPFTTDSTGSTYTTYVPTQIGNYTITTNFPNNTYPTTAFIMGRTAPILEGTIMLASSKSMTLEVVEDVEVQFYPGHPLPTEYWSRPVDPNLREWYSITGNWVERTPNSIALYQDNAPETPHILWANQYEQGGISGGLYENNIIGDMYAGDAYEGRFANAVVINGVLYYNAQGNGLYAQTSIPGIQAIDLHTGEKLWYLNGTFLNFGQTMYFPSYNVNGVWNYLWSQSGSTYTAYSTNDGSFQFQFYNVPSGTRVWGPNGEILIYQINYNAGWMALWNSTLAGMQNAVIGQPTYGSWDFGTLGMDAQGRGARDFGGPTNPTNDIGQQINSAFPVTRHLNGALDKCYTWNVTIPTGLSANYLRVYQGDRVVGMAYDNTQVRMWGLSLQGITTTRNASINTQSISKLFDKTWSAPSEWLEGLNMLYYTGASDYVTDETYGDGVMAIFSKELTTHYGFSLVDGSYLWTTESENYLDLYGAGAMEHTWYFAYGHLYSVGLAGILYAYDLQTGQIDWTYTLQDPYNEPVTGENWWGWIDIIADGKIYIGTLEHSANSPMPRGAPYACVNATDGSEIFRINGLMRETRWGGNPVMGDCIIAGYDTYNGMVYAMGKGPSQTTVTAPNSGLASGQSVLISGSVMDVSPGTKSDALTLRLPNGVAAVSDDSQSQYMLYLYKQFELPSNTTGVPVTISVIDANGNYRDIGTTTTDATGTYLFSWMPDIPGKYTVIATFAGSEAYYGSSAQTGFVVDEEPAATAEPTATTQSMADLYFLPMSIVIIIAIIVIGLVIILMLRKRP
jgi:hypothetical protein